MDAHHSAALIELYLRATALKLLPRTGWLQRGVSQAESVAEHTFGVALLALLAIQATPTLDRERVLAIALVHDLAETLLGDLSASARRLLGADVKQAAELRAIEELFAGSAGGDTLAAMWREYTEGQTPEARLVKALDRIELLAQALIYEQAGNRALAEFWQNADQSWPEEFPFVRELAQNLIQKHTRLKVEG